MMYNAIGVVMKDLTKVLGWKFGKVRDGEGKGEVKEGGGDGDGDGDEGMGDDGDQNVKEDM